MDAAAKTIGRLLGLVMRGWAATWRKDARQLNRLDALLRDGDRVIAVFWHGTYFPLFALAAGRQAVIFTSRSFRGYVIAELSRYFGYHPSIIPQDHHGFRHLEKALDEGPRLAAIALDGPSGPFHSVKSGAIRAASALGLRIVPIVVRSRPRFIVARRWDRREIPPPFAEVRLLVGDPLDVPPQLTMTALADWQTVLHDRMEALDTDRQYRSRASFQLS